MIEYCLQKIDQRGLVVETHVEWDGGAGLKVHPLDDGEDFLLPHLGANQVTDQYRNLHHKLANRKSKLGKNHK